MGKQPFDRSSAFVLVLHEKGTYRVPRSAEERSPRASTAIKLKWGVMELWTQPAEALLDGPDVGLIPWAPLTQFSGSPEVLLKRCRDRIDKDGGQEHANLLAVTQVMAQLRFNHPNWLDILGGKKAMIESPLLTEFISEAEQRTLVKSIMKALRVRLEAPSAEMEAKLSLVKNVPRLDRLLDFALVCPTLQSFEERLQQDLTQIPTPSTRKKRSPRKAVGDA